MLAIAETVPLSTLKRSLCFPADSFNSICLFDLFTPDLRVALRSELVRPYTSSSFLILKIGDWDFAGGPVVKIPHFQCRDAGGTSSTLAWGTKIPQSALKYIYIKIGD